MSFSTINWASSRNEQLLDREPCNTRGLQDVALSTAHETAAFATSRQNCNFYFAPNECGEGNRCTGTSRRDRPPGIEREGEGEGRGGGGECLDNR